VARVSPLSKGRIDQDLLGELLAGHSPEDNATRGKPRVYAVDLTTWPRCDAESSPERGYYYHPSRYSAGQPIVAGWAYQLIAEIGFARDTWVAPVDVRREIVNRTVHGVMHLGWVSDATGGGYRGQMAVYAKPNGLLGTAYMAAIKPFRYMIVYPALMQQIGREWRARTGQPKLAHQADA
jgi:hypothetical protein